MALQTVRPWAMLQAMPLVLRMALLLELRWASLWGMSLALQTVRLWAMQQEKPLVQRMELLLA